MNSFRTLLFTALIATPLIGCSQPKPQAAATQDNANGFIQSQVDNALTIARKKLREENLSINGDHGVIVNGKRISSTDKSLPKAEISPKGDLLINGKPVDITAAQRQQLLDYRSQIIGIAEAGMAIGSQGAGLAGKAMSGVMDVIFGGEKAQQDFEAKIEAEGKKIEAEAAKLCTRLPALLASQQTLASALPAFKPYATMTQADIDDCSKDNRTNTASASHSATSAANAATAQTAQAFDVPKAPALPAFGKRDCAFSRDIALKLDTTGARTVQLQIGSDDLHAEAVPAGASLNGRACASSQEALDGIKVSQSRQGDKLVVKVENEYTKGNVNLNAGSLQFKRYAFTQLHAQIPDNVLVQVIAGSGDVIVNNAKRASVDLGSGDAELRGVQQDAYAQVGSGDLLVEGAGSLRILGIGSGDAVVRNIAGAVQVDRIGSGDLRIQRSGGVEIGAVGSGDVKLETIRGNVHVKAVGSGDVVAKDIQGDLSVDAIGSGDVSHRNVSGSLNLPRRD